MNKIKSKFLKILPLVALSIGFSYASTMDDYINQINSVYHDIGLQGFGKGAYVQIGSNGKIDLKGDYKSYKDFEEAFYIAESIAGVSNVNPDFNVINASIIERPLEECAAYSMENEPSKCPNLISAYNTSSQKPEKLAIIVAVGKFEILPQQLRQNVDLSPGPENDANLVSNILAKKGFKIEKIYDQEATFQNVENAIRNAIAELPNGSTLVLYFSTHGSPQTPLGETGAVLYDSFVGNIPGNCNYTSNTQNNETGSRDIVVTNALSSAQGICKVIRRSLIVSRDVLPLIAESGKDINLVVIEDICYSGASFKGYIPDAKIDDVYAPTKVVADNLVGLDPYPMILVTSTSGEQTAEQAKINVKNGELCEDKPTSKNCVTHGIFTYYYFTGLPKYQYYLYKTYQAEFPVIENVAQTVKSGPKSESNKQKNIANTNKNATQTPLFISNKNIANTNKNATQTPLFISNKNLGDFKF